MEELFQYLKRHYLLSEVARYAKVGRNTPRNVLLSKSDSRISTREKVIAAAEAVKAKHLSGTNKIEQKAAALVVKE